MNGSKRARNVASIANNTKIYGIMGGTVTPGNHHWSVRTSIYNQAAVCNCIPGNPAAGLAYMKKNQILSVNPQCSGGVGKRMLMMCF
jgi:hypothetical protein